MRDAGLHEMFAFAYKSQPVVEALHRGLGIEDDGGDIVIGHLAHDFGHDEQAKAPAPGLLQYGDTFNFEDARLVPADPGRPQGKSIDFRQHVLAGLVVFIPFKIGRDLLFLAEHHCAGSAGLRPSRGSLTGKKLIVAIAENYRSSQDGTGKSFDRRKAGL